MVSTETAKAESSQALFCYIADVIGSGQIAKKWDPYINNITNNKYKDLKANTYDDFKKEFKKEIKKAFSSPIVNVSPNFQENQIHDFLSDPRQTNPIWNGWFLSSLKIAKKLLEDLDKITSPKLNVKKLTSKISSKGPSKVSYVRGDMEVMGVIAELFKLANFNTQRAKMKFFGNLNKWNPADIYYATEKAKQELKSLISKPDIKSISFPVLNEFIGKLMNNGELLPLSLKKGVHEIQIKKINFNRKEEERLIAETICTGVETGGVIGVKMDTAANKFSFIDKDKKKGSRDVYIKLKSGQYDGRIQIRHTPASGGKPQQGVKIQLSYKGASAFGGQLVGIPIFSQIVSRVDPSFASAVSRTFNKGYTDFVREMNRYRAAGGEDLYKKGNADKKSKDEFNNDVGIISALTIMNKLIKVIGTYFKNPGEKQHNVLREIFQYVSSRTILSSPFVIAKD